MKLPKEMTDHDLDMAIWSINSALSNKNINQNKRDSLSSHWCMLSREQDRRAGRNCKICNP